MKFNKFTSTNVELISITQLNKEISELEALVETKIYREVKKSSFAI